jgi:hypothetical protein
MSFNESLSLDVSQALRDIDRLEAQLTQAAQQFRVEAFKAIDDLRSTPIRLTVDTAGITAEVEQAVAVANPVVDPDTSRIRPEIDAAIPNEVDVPIDADTTGARAEIRRLGQDVDGATSQARLLRTALATIGTAGVITGIRAVADAGWALQEQLSGSTVVFGEFATEAQQFASNAPAFGLAADEALRAANNFGLMAQSAGLAQGAATEFATTITARAADIASLRDLDLNETILALQSGLAGETEPLRRLGSFLNEARVQAEAFRLGLADATGEVDDAAKIQARYSLILQDTAIAQGDFARTSESLTNSQRVLRAEFRDMIAQIGIDLAPAFAEAVQAGGDLLPVFENLVRSVLPPLLDIATDLAPAFGNFAQILVALSPVLDVVAAAVGAIPAPLIAAVGAFVTLNAAAAPAVGVLRNLGVAIPRTTAAFGALSAGLAGASLIFAAYADQQQRAAVFEAERKATVDALNRSLDEGMTLTEALTAAVEGARDADEDFNRALREIGVNAAEFGAAATDVDGFTAALAASSDVRQGSIDLSFHEITALGNQARAIREGVSARLDYLSQQSESNRALVEESRLRATSTDGTVDEAAALDRVNEALARQAAENERVIATYGPFVAGVLGSRDALARVGDEAPAVADAVRDLRSGITSGADGFLGLALAAGEAGLSTEALADVANLTGTNVEDLTGFVELATGALEDFVSAATGQLPTVSSVFEDTFARAQQAASDFAETIRESDPAGAQAAEDAARVTAEAFRDGLQIATFELADFQNDLAALTAAGFAPLAGTLARQGQEAGNALADELADALASGNTELLTGLQDAQTTFEAQSLETVAFLRDTLGPEILSQTAIIQAALVNIVEDADPARALEIQGDLARLELDDQGRQIAVVAALAGEEAARSYGEALELEQATIDEAVAAGVALGQNAPVDEAFAAGEATGLGFAAGISSRFVISGLQEAIRVLTDQVPDTISDQLAISSPSKVTEALGGFVAEGFALGIRGGVGMVGQSADALAQAAMVNTSRMALVGAPAGPSGARGLDGDALVGAIESLAGKVGDSNSWTINGAADPFSTGQEVQRQQRSRERRRGR